MFCRNWSGVGVGRGGGKGKSNGRETKDGGNRGEYVGGSSHSAMEGGGRRGEVVAMRADHRGPKCKWIGREKRRERKSCGLLFRRYTLNNKLKH